MYKIHPLKNDIKDISRAEKDEIGYLIKKTTTKHTHTHTHTTNTRRTTNSSYEIEWLDIKFCPGLTRHALDVKVYLLYMLSGGYTSSHGKSI